MHVTGAQLAAPPGLKNLGHTCYANAVLQALLHAPRLREYLLDTTPAASHFAACTNRSHGGAIECCLCELCALAQRPSDEAALRRFVQSLTLARPLSNPLENGGVDGGYRAVMFDRLRGVQPW